MPSSSKQSTYVALSRLDAITLHLIHHVRTALSEYHQPHGIDVMEHRQADRRYPRAFRQAFDVWVRDIDMDLT